MTVSGVYGSIQNDYSAEKISFYQAGQPDQTKEQESMDTISNRRDDSVPFEVVLEIDSSLDMQKAISDMRKDQVLVSYQYFVESVDDFFGGRIYGNGMII